MARELEHWLGRLGLSTYAALFADNQVDFEVLRELTEQDLKDLDIPLGHRKKLLKAIAALPSDAAMIGNGDALLASAPQQRNEAERRQLTVLFCDLIDSTALSSRIDPEEMREVIQAYQASCAKVVAEYGGYIAKFMGDGVLVYFGYPQAHENDAERAARAGLGITNAIATLAANKPELRNLDLAVRVGINTGLVVVGDRVGEGAAEEVSVVGESANVAARLQSVAGKNDVVIGPLTHALIGSVFTCEDLGERLVKGIADPVHAWRVVREREIEAGTEAEPIIWLTPLVGRQEEMGLLLRSWEASKRGHGQVVFIQGEAGIGKSRLVAAMREKVAPEDHLWVPIRCSAYHANTTLYPVIEHLKRAIGSRHTDSPAEKLAKLERALQGQSLASEIAVPLLAELMSVPLPTNRYPVLPLGAEERREQTLDALAGWLIEEAERRPVLQVWEDLHWADPTTLELLRLCIEQSPTVSMMNVLTYRSDFVPSWTMRSHMTPITLNRLERPEVEALIAQRLDGRTLPKEVIEHIVERTDGVPLYVEELTKAMVEASIPRQRDGFQFAQPPAAMTIPPTLQDLLMARLDRLPSIREVAQIGSILGREFAYEMLHAIASLDETELHNGLDRLVDSELLYQRGRRPRAKYIFKHALVQDAAYQSLLKRTRQYYHLQVAELLEDRYPDIVKTQPELVAHHYARAAHNRKAIEYLTRCAERSAERYAHAEATAAIEAACGHAERLPADERDQRIATLIVRQAESLHFLGRRQEIIDLLLRHRSRVEGLEDAVLAAQYDFWLGFAHAWLGHRLEAGECLNRSLAEAKRAGDEAVLGRVHRALATECVYSGRPLEEAIAHARQSAALLERTDDRFWLSQALFTLSYCCIFAGEFDSSLEAARRLEAFAETTGIRRARANAAMLTGLGRAMRGDGETAVALCEQALEITPDDFETAFILACLGRACWEAGDLARAVPVLEQAVELADHVRSLQFRAWFRTMLGEAYLLQGELAKSAVVVQQALEASTASEFRIGIGLSKQLLGRIARTRGVADEARQHLEEAAGIFAATGARFELARTNKELAAIDDRAPDHLPSAT